MPKVFHKLSNRRQKDSHLCATHFEPLKVTGTGWPDRNGESYEAVRHTVEDYKKKVDSLEKIFHKVAPPPEASRHESYRSVRRFLGKGSRVEDIQRLAGHPRIKTATKGELEELANTVRELSAIPPSQQEEDLINISHSGHGDIIAAEDIVRGAKNTYSGSGTAYFGPVTQHVPDAYGQILDKCWRQTQENYKDTKEKDLLQDLASNYEGYKNFNQPRVAGTCEWFFNDNRFRKWRDSDTSSLLWLSAGPKCGKSVLSRALIDERLLSTNVMTSTVCHFFFKDRDNDRMYGANALCAILHQLFTRDPSGSLIGNALPSHKNHGKALARNSSELWEILLKCASYPGVGEIVCILDALDECERGSREEFIDKLKRFYCQPHCPSKASSKLKFLITSRPYDDLEDCFRDFSTTEYLRFDGDDKSAEIGREINLVIDERVNEIAGSFTTDDRRKISERLKSMENRTYLWLYLIFDTIREKPSFYGKRSSIERLLSNIPSNVSEAYENILSRSQDEKQTEILLQIILAAARPLTLDEANVALTLALQDERFASRAALDSELWPRDNKFGSIIKNLCGLFVNVYDSKLYFIHQTAREFLTHSERRGTWEGRLNTSKSSSTMSRLCLQFLLIPGIDTPAENNPAMDKEHPFLSYAATYWPLHYVSQEVAVADQSRKDARMLCNVAGHQARIWAPVYFRYLDWRGWTDSALASYLGLARVVGDILDMEGTDVNIQSGVCGTALQAASARGHRDIVQVLLDKGTTLHAASEAW